MIKLFVKIILQFFFWKPKNWRKGLKARLESRLYSIAIRRRAKSCGRDMYILGGGVNVTYNTSIGDGVGFGKNVKIRGDGPVFIGKRAVIAEDSLVYTQVHDYDNSDVLPFGWGYTYPETRIDDYAWIGLRCIVLPGAHVGEGAVVQAGSVVMGTIPPCAVAAGNPAKVIGWRDVDHYNRLKIAAGERPVEKPDAVKSDIPAPVSSAKRTQPMSGGGDRLADVFSSVFSVPHDEVAGMVYKDHPAWDSAGHMALVAALEREFGMTFLPADIYRLKSYADAVKMVGEAAPMEIRRPDKPLFDLKRDGVAVICDGKEFSYRELESLSEKAVAGLMPHTVKTITNAQDIDTVALFVGCVNRGIVPLMLPAGMDAGLKAKLESTYEGKPTSPDLALLLTTSGSTGSPKLVRISRANIIADNRLGAELLGIDPSTRMLMILPICYAWGLSVACAVLDVGGTLIMTGRSVMDEELYDEMISARATHFAGVPYMYEALDRVRFFKREFPSLRGLLLAGGALSPRLRRHFAEFSRQRGWYFCEGYGQTETTGVMCTIRTDAFPDRIGSIGKAGGIGAFRVDGGELVYEGPIVAMGYAVTAEDLLKGDEWNGVRHTGDLAEIDGDGYVTLTGRASRFVKIFGNRVSLQEVEELVKDAFLGAGCAASGADNDLHVFVTAAEADAVERFLVSKLRFNATVMKVHVLGEIPVNANGKTDYPALKDLCVR